MKSEMQPYGGLNGKKVNFLGDRITEGCTASSMDDRYPTAKIAVLTPLYGLIEDDPYGDPRKEIPSLPLRDYVNIIREVAEYYALPILDLYATSGFQPNVPVL